MCVQAACLVEPIGSVAGDAGFDVHVRGHNTWQAVCAACAQELKPSWDQERGRRTGGRVGGWEVGRDVVDAGWKSGKGGQYSLSDDYGSHSQTRQADKTASAPGGQAGARQPR